MRFYLDTEFSERGNQFPVKLISLGLVCENDQTFYEESAEFREQDCNDWVKQNVLPSLRRPGNGVRFPIDLIAHRCEQWVREQCDGEKPEFWGYYSSYDWVVFAQMFGTMINLPKGWPMYCRDIKQLADSLGNPKLPPQTSTEHNALNDAQWNKTAHEFLMGLEKA